MKRAKKIKVICANCGRVLELPVWDVRRRREHGNKNFYCDRACFLEHRRRKKVARAKEMRKLRTSKNGSRRLTLKEIGERFGKITPQRVHAILKEVK